METPGNELLPTVVEYFKWACQKRAFYVINKKEGGKNKRHTAVTNMTSPQCAFYFY